MRYYQIIIIVWFLSSCQREEVGSAKALVATGGVNPHGVALVRKDLFGIPPLDKLISGQFDKAGMAAVFESVTGIPLPNDVIPISGEYKIYNEDSGRGQNSRSIKSYFSAPPETASRLISEINRRWEKTYKILPDWKIQVYDHGEKDFGPIKVSSESKSLFVFNPYAYYQESSQIVIDPITGGILVSGSNNRNETIADRQVEEDHARMDKERMDEERMNKDR